MQIRIFLYRCLLIAWMMYGGSHTLSYGYSYDQAAKSQSWGYKSEYGSSLPTSGSYRSASTGTSSYGVSSTSGSSYGSQAVRGFSYSRTYAPEFNQDVCPGYSFQSTSSFSSIIDDAASGVTMQKVARSSWNPWGIPDDDPIGVVPNPAPVGEPLVLILIALLYGIGLHMSSRRRAKV